MVLLVKGRPLGSERVKELSLAAEFVRAELQVKKKFIFFVAKKDTMFSWIGYWRTDPEWANLIYTRS